MLKLEFKTRKLYETLIDLRDGPLEKWWGGGGGWEIFGSQDFFPLIAWAWFFSGETLCTNLFFFLVDRHYFLYFFIMFNNLRLYGMQ